ncbi:MAG: LysR family transcriptional regulator [Lachnospiraceae bacterium]
MDINLEYYKIFYYVGQKKSITLAAEALSISQPAVSQAIRHLEEALQVTLFVRTSKGVRFTAEGEMFYTYVQRGYEYILSGEKKLREMRDLEEGEICIGASDMTLRFYLLEYLERFHEEHPNIKIKVTNAPTPETLHHLQQGRIDFGVISTPVQEKHHFKIQPVREVEDIFVAGRKFEQLKGKLLTYQMLQEYPIICLEPNTSTRSSVDAFLAKQRITLLPEFELATSDMLIQFAQRGLGVACVMADFAKEKIADKSLFRLQFEQPIPKRQIAIVTDANTPLSAAARELLHQFAV